MIYGDHIFQLGDNGVLSAINKRTGHTFWKRSLGALSASSPAVRRQHRLCDRARRAQPRKAGRVVALNYANGAIRWSRNLPSPSESSPLLDHGRLFFGSQNGTVYALNARNGQVDLDLSRRRRGQGQPDASGGILYFGDYSGHVQAISERTGRRIWRQRLGRRAARQRHLLLHRRGLLRARLPGQHRRAHLRLRRRPPASSTGPCRPAPTSTPRPPSPTLPASARRSTSAPTTARSTRSTPARDTSPGASTRGGRISGSATIVGHTVYFADLGTHRTYGLGHLHRPAARSRWTPAPSIR